VYRVHGNSASNKSKKEPRANSRLDIFGVSPQFLGGVDGNRGTRYRLSRETVQIPWSIVRRYWPRRIWSRRRCASRATHSIRRDFPTTLPRRRRRRRSVSRACVAVVRTEAWHTCRGLRAHESRNVGCNRVGGRHRWSGECDAQRNENRDGQSPHEVDSRGV